MKDIYIPDLYLELQKIKATLKQQHTPKTPLLFICTITINKHHLFPLITHVKSLSRPFQIALEILSTAIGAEKCILVCLEVICLNCTQRLI